MTIEIDQALVESAIKGRYDGLSARIRRLPYSWDHELQDCSGIFFYLSFRDGHPTLDEFVTYLESRIVDFALPESEKVAAAEAYDEGDSGRWVQAVTKAQRLFVRARDEGVTSGEPGELTLFVLLEGVKSAPQIACKMRLKTASDMHVHGADSIHVMWRAQAQTLRFIWGESKLHSSVSSGIRSAVESIQELIAERGGGRSQIEREIEIVREHMDVSDPELRDVLIKCFDPYSELSNEREEAFACFIGFDYGVLEDIAGTGSNEEVEAEFRSEYKEQIQRACIKFEETVVEKGLEHCRFEVFLIPFQDVRELRTKFLMRIGATDD